MTDQTTNQEIIDKYLCGLPTCEVCVNEDGPGFVPGQLEEGDPRASLAAGPGFMADNDSGLLLLVVERCPNCRGTTVDLSRVADDLRRIRNQYRLVTADMSTTA